MLASQMNTNHEFSLTIPIRLKPTNWSIEAVSRSFAYILSTRLRPSSPITICFFHSHQSIVSTLECHKKLLHKKTQIDSFFLSINDVLWEKLINQKKFISKQFKIFSLIELIIVVRKISKKKYLKYYLLHLRFDREIHLFLVLKFEMMSDSL